MSRKKMTWIALFVVAFGTAACSSDVAGPDLREAAVVEQEQEQGDRSLQDAAQYLRDQAKNRKRPN